MSHHNIPRRPVGPTYRPVSDLTNDGRSPDDHDIEYAEATYSLDPGHRSSFDPGQDENPRDSNHSRDQGFTRAPEGYSSTFEHDKVTDNQNPAEKLSQKGPIEKSSRGWLFHLRAWWPEAAFSVSSYALLIALIVVLRRFDRRPGPDSLNTIVAIIATTCRAMTVVPIAEGLSQLKWNSFARSERPLADLYIFDQASRGPFGSLMLLLRAKGRLLSATTVAAVILISGLATSSLTQATISIQPTPERLVEEAAARKYVPDGSQIRTMPVPGDRDYPEGSPDRFRHFYGLTDASSWTIMMQETDRRDFLYQQVAPRCPVGDCRWESLNSVGICATMRNTTAELQVGQVDVNEANKTAELENFTEFDLKSVVNITSALENRPTCTVFDDYHYDVGGGLMGVCDVAELSVSLGVVLSDYLFIYKIQEFYETEDFGNEQNYRAAQVTFRWCSHRYNVSVAAGVAQTRLEKETLNSRELEDGRIMITSNDGEEEYKIMPERLGLALTGNWLDGDLLFRTIVRKIFPQWDGIDQDQRPPDSWPLLESLSNDIALSATNYLRLNFNGEEGNVRGYASIGQIVVVHWPWLSLLAIQVLFTSVFLIYVIVDTARQGVSIVKSSALAELMAIPRATESNVHDGSQRSSFQVDGIQSKIEPNVKGRLVQEGPGWQLDVHRDDSDGKKGPWLLRWLS